MSYQLEYDLAGKKLIADIKKVAKQSDGSAFVKWGDIVVSATVCYNKIPEEEIDFMPLIVDYRENTSAAGKFPGGFFKREGRPTESDILKSRLIDRSLRPLFPKGYYHDTQVICYVYSADPEHDPDMIGLNACALALYFSPIPFNAPLAAVRVGLVDGNYILNPSYAQLQSSELNLIVAGTYEGIIMVEAKGKETPEAIMISAIRIAFEKIQELSIAYKRSFDELQIKKFEVKTPVLNMDVYNFVKEKTENKLREAFFTPGKLASKDAINTTYKELIETVPDDDKDRKRNISMAFHKIKDELMRTIIIEEKRRTDNRGYSDIRAIECEVGILPRTHGSALFTRGETQSIISVTLGTADDVQIVDVLEGESSKRFMLHYNFPPFSVNEIKPLRAPSRREIGHGALAEKALLPVIPLEEQFPYTIRIVSDILESNGSSSMATVCGGSLALMDAGVPVKAPVAGIAMGLVKKGDKYAILTDIAGEEDYSGDMDFKVAGTENGITAFQMDIKVHGLSIDLMAEALEHARNARLRVLETMNKTIEKPRESISPYAPKLMIKMIPIEKIAALIGPGGKMVKSIIERTGVKIDIEDSGKVMIASHDEEAIKKACVIIDEIIFEAIKGKAYLGKVKRIENYGAFVEISPGTTGLMHISEFATYRINNLASELKEGDEIMVKVLDVEDNKIRLSHREFYKGKPNKEGQEHQDRPDRQDRPEHQDRRDRQDRPDRQDRNRSDGQNRNRFNRSRD